MLYHLIKVLISACTILAVSEIAKHNETPHFNFASAALTASKLGRSFGVGVCSAYCTTPFRSMTKAARAAVSPMP